jgi:PAS domain S-box-containing protein
MSAFKIAAELKKTVPRKLAVIFTLFTIAILFFGFFYYKSQRNRIFSESQNSLSAIASLKIDQITQWHNERLGDAKVIRDNKPLIRSIRHFFTDNNKELKEEVLTWMKSVHNGYDYSNVLIIDTLFKVRLTVSKSDSVAGDIIGKEMNDVLSDHKIIMTDIHQSKIVSNIHIDVLIPLIDSVRNKPMPVGIAVLRIDPAKVLFPLIQSWPTDSKSSETLLLRTEDDSVLYLNELRHKQNSALKLKFPMTNENLLAVKAANGFQGISEGRDYRNIPVVGSLSRIPGLPWYMVAKVDKEEILSPLKRYVFLIIIVVVLLILINASIFGFWIWQQRIRSYRDQLLNERSIRESEKRLIESEELFRKLFENMLNGFAYCKMIFEEGHPRDFLYINVNEAFESLTGLKDVKGKKVSEVIPGIQKADPELFERYGRVALTGKPEVFETYVESLKMWFMISVYSPKKEYFVAVFDVITERKLAEDTLRENEKKLREAQEMAHLGFWKWNIKTGDVEWSDEVFKIFHLNPEEFTPQIDSILALSPWEEDHQRNTELINRAIETHEPGDYEQKFLRSDKSIGYYYSTFQGKYDENGVLISIVGTVLDITERKMAEEALRSLNEELEHWVFQRTEQLQAANKELEAFSYSVSHDLRAPVRAVNSYTKILMEEYENILDDEGKRICGIISSSASQMGELIDDLLSFSRIGRSSLNPSLLDMKSMVLSVFADISSSEEKSRTNLKTGKLHKAYGDASLIRLVWNNLISNAIKYSSKENSSEISIRSVLKDHAITYYVKDNGVGFDMQYKHKLFGVFQRLHNGSEFEGNGVGLAIVQRIVLMHGGKVKAEGEIGKGATFCFSLPVQDENKTTHGTRHTTHG